MQSHTNPAVVGWCTALVATMVLAAGQSVLASDNRAVLSTDYGCLRQRSFDDRLPPPIFSPDELVGVWFRFNAPEPGFLNDARLTWTQGDLSAIVFEGRIDDEAFVNLSLDPPFSGEDAAPAVLLTLDVVSVNSTGTRFVVAEVACGFWMAAGHTLQIKTVKGSGGKGRTKWTDGGSSYVGSRGTEYNFDVEITHRATDSHRGQHTVNHTFDWGDGTTVGPQAESTAAHTWTRSGVYLVKVTVTDAVHPNLHDRQSFRVRIYNAAADDRESGPWVDGYVEGISEVLLGNWQVKGPQRTDRVQAVIGINGENVKNLTLTRNATIEYCNGMSVASPAKDIHVADERPTKHPIDVESTVPITVGIRRVVVNASGRGVNIFTNAAVADANSTNGQAALDKRCPGDR